MEEAYLNPRCITSTADKTPKSFFRVSEKRDTSTWSFSQGQTQIWYGIDNQLAFLLNSSVTYEIALSHGGLKDKKFHCHYGVEMASQITEFIGKVCKIEDTLSFVLKNWILKFIKRIYFYCITCVLIKYSYFLNLEVQSLRWSDGRSRKQ